MPTIFSDSVVSFHLMIGFCCLFYKQNPRAASIRIEGAYYAFFYDVKSYQYLGLIYIFMPNVNEIF